MNFKTPGDKRRIVATAAFCSPVVKRCVQEILEKEGYSYEKKLGGWEEFFEVKTKDGRDGKAEFFLKNLYLEIATKDRDDELLEWDARLLDFSFFREKVTGVISSKIRPLLIILSTDDTEKMEEKLTEWAKSDGCRMRMASFKIGKDKKSDGD